ncbi:complex I NDUFA9 subunit family protein [Zavarzinia sp. CC-PAN008]|uniref:complex I NDUFA9 subunit family protein n=1 Tax=Zavarzinia sp. CC-PAN008 TaxID=3243332 RepID=UPI003F743C20
MAGMTVQRLATVIGGSGFIGRHVVQRLARRGFRVRVAVRRPDGAGFVKPMGAVGQVMPVQANVRNARSIAAVVQGSEIVVNLVGILAEGGPQRFDAVHAEGAGTVARAAAAAGVRQLVHVSAIGADPASESDYLRTKAAGEAAVRAAFPDATIVRPSIVFGQDDSFLNFFAAMARYSPVLPLVGGGTTRFQPVHVGDVADAILAALETEGAAGRIYELGGPRVYTFRELMEFLLAEVRRKRLLVPLPWGVAGMLGSVLQALPGKLLTADQVRSLKQDNVADGSLPGLTELGITPTSVEAVAPAYLWRFRKGGEFSHAATGT